MRAWTLVSSASRARRSCAALAAFQPDIVLSDLSMPGFSGDDALRIVRETAPEVPFIFVSGTMGEENAVAALQKGANDYIIKHQPARLPSAVARAIRDARSAVERARVETELMRAQRPKACRCSPPASAMTCATSCSRC